jgi:hypothetical protein
MARYMDEANKELWRAVLTIERNGIRRTTAYGPYEHKRTAAFVLSYMVGTPWHSQEVVGKRLEKTQVAWEEVE